MFNRIVAELASKGPKPERLMIDATSRWITPSASSLSMQVRLQSRCSANADALTGSGFPDRREIGLATDGRHMLTVSVIMLVPVAVRQDVGAQAVLIPVALSCINLQGQGSDSSKT